MGIREEVFEIDDDGQPRIRWTRLATVSVGSVGLAYISYVIGLVRTVGSGAASSIDSFVDWLVTGIELTLGIPANVLGSVWQANTEFLALFGVLAPLVAVAQLAVVVLILLSAFDRGRRYLSGVIS